MVKIGGWEKKGIEMTDRKRRRLHWRYWQACVAGIVIQILVCAFALGLGPVYGFSPKASHLAFSYLFALLVPLIAYVHQARNLGRLPARRADPSDDRNPRYRHISGASALWVIAFSVLIAGLSSWATILQNDPAISGGFGIAVIGLILVLFLWFATRSYRPGRNSKQNRLGNTGLLGLLGQFFSTVDSWLVFPVANSVGMGLDRAWQRYAILLGTFIPVLILGWNFPESYKFLPLLWAFIAILSIARQWSWVEDDRDVAMLKRSFEDKDLRIGFKQDPRDEALVSFGAMLLIMPVALRAVFLGLGDQIEYKPGANADFKLSAHSYFAWMSVFGTELAKAVPFVDWAEVFRVEGRPFIVLDQENSTYQWVIFGMRVIVDLILLAALVQAISILSRTSKQKQMFFQDGTLFQLDPFIEPVEFRHLALGHSGEWKLRDKTEFESFPSYDEDRLVRLALPTKKGETDDDHLGTEHDAIRFVARSLLKRDEARSPEYLLLLHVRRKNANPDRSLEILDSIETKAEPVEIERLMQVHSYLNRERKFFDVRRRLVHIIAMNSNDPAAVEALITVLVGSGIERQESRWQIRELALLTLALPGRAGNRRAAFAIAEAAQRDQSARVREQASAILRQNADWFELEEKTREMIGDAVGENAGDATADKPNP